MVKSIQLLNTPRAFQRTGLPRQVCFFAAIGQILFDLNVNGVTGNEPRHAVDRRVAALRDKFVKPSKRELFRDVAGSSQSRAEYHVSGVFALLQATKGESLRGQCRPLAFRDVEFAARRLCDN